MRIKSILLASAVFPLLAIASMPAGAAPPAFMLAQAQPPAPTPPGAVQAKPDDDAAANEGKERDRKRNNDRRAKQKADAAKADAAPKADAPKPDAAKADAKEPDRRPGDPRRRQEADRAVQPPAIPTTPLLAPLTTPQPVAPVVPAAPAVRQAQPATPPASAAPSAPGTRQQPVATERPGGWQPLAARSGPASVPAETKPAETKPAAPPPTITAATAPPPAAAAELNARRLQDVRGSRTQTQDGDRTVIREGGRTIIREGNQSIIRHNENDRFRAGARDVSVQQRGSDSVTTVVRPNGSRVVTVLDPAGRLQRRSSFDQGGREIVIIDGARGPAYGARPYVAMPPPRLRIPRNAYIVAAGIATAAVIYETLSAPPVDVVDRAYGLDEIRWNAGVRDRMRRIDVDTVTFASGSWEVTPDQAGKLQAIADGILQAVRANPAEVFMIEGYTDAVGTDVDNLSLSDRRAEAIAVALTDRFGVPPENLTTQGYGEQFLKIPTEKAERQNRRVAIRRITPLLSGTGPAPT